MKKILIVDDSMSIRALVSVTLGNDDCLLLEAGNAAEALQICAREKPELIIMDVNMPGEINGIRATQILKKCKDTAECRVIMLSGVNSGSAVDDALGAGAEAFLHKPFSPLELIDRVEEALRAN